MKKRILQALVVVLFLAVMIAIGVAQQRDERQSLNNKEEVCIEEENDLITINTTIINAIDESIDLFCNTLLLIGFDNVIVKVLGDRFFIIKGELILQFNIFFSSGI